MGLGLLLGLAVATGLSVYVVVAYLVTDGDILSGYGVSLLTVIATYYLGGMVGGLIVGLLSPFYRTWYGAMLLGWLAVIPLYSVVTFADAPGELLTNIPDVLIISGLVGPLVGLFVWLFEKRAGWPPK